MIPLTEGELVRMREVQAKAAPGLWGREAQIGGPVQITSAFEILAKLFGERAWDNALLMILAHDDWPRVTEWALEARRLLGTLLETPAVKRLDFEDGSPWIRVQINEAWIQEARRLLGE